MKNALEEVVMEELRARLDALSEPPDGDWLTELAAHEEPYVIGPIRVELPPERIAEMADLLLREWPEPTDGRRP